MIGVIILSALCIGLLCGIVWALINHEYVACLPMSFLLCMSVMLASVLLADYNTVHAITTQYIDKDISYPVEVEIVRTEKAAIKHQENIAEKLYNDLNRIDNTWIIETKDNSIIVTNREKYYVFYRVQCKIKSK